MTVAFRLRELAVAPFCRPLASPFRTAAAVVNQREGFILRLTLEGGGVGYGEAAPLAGYSRETLAEVAVALGRGDFHALASLRMAWESAAGEASGWQDLALRQQPLAINAVLPLGASTAAVEQLWQEGFRVFKCKVAPDSVEESLRAVRLLQEISGGDFSLRLDANNSFTPAQAAALLPGFADFPIEYCEDPWLAPLPPVGERKALPFPIAVDCPLRGLENFPVFLERFDYFILKPMVLGGMEATKDAIALVEGNGKKFVITSALETEVGRRALEAFALSLPGKLPAFGLATGRFFTESYLPDQPRLQARRERGSEEAQWLAGLPWGVL